MSEELNASSDDILNVIDETITEDQYDTIKETVENNFGIPTNELPDLKKLISSLKNNPQMFDKKGPKTNCVYINSSRRLKNINLSKSSFKRYVTNELGKNYKTKTVQFEDTDYKVLYNDSFKNRRSSKLLREKIGNCIILCADKDVYTSDVLRWEKGND